MKKLIQIIAIIIIFIIAVLYLLDGLEFTEAEKVEFGLDLGSLLCDEMADASS